MHASSVALLSGSLDVLLNAWLMCSPILWLPCCVHYAKVQLVLLEVAAAEVQELTVLAAA